MQVGDAAVAIDHEHAALLIVLSFDRGLPKATKPTAGEGEERCRAEGRARRANELQGVVNSERGVRDELDRLEVDPVAVDESRHEVLGAIAHVDHAQAEAGQLMQARGEFGDVLTARQACKVPHEHHDRRPVCPPLPEGRRAAFGIDHVRRGERLGHRRAGFDHAASITVAVRGAVRRATVLDAVTEAPKVTPELFDDLVVVVAVADARSVSGAARTLGVDGSTVSRRVRRLEESLGIALFHRGGRGMELSEPGRRLVQRVQAAMNEVSLGLDEALVDPDELRGRVVVTAPTELGTALLTPVLSTFSREHPDVDFELQLGDRVLSLDKREADIALRTTRPAKGDVVARKLRAPFGFVVRSPELPVEQARLRWLAYTGGDPIVEALVESVPDARIVLRTNDMAGIRAACLEGMGACLLPGPFVDLLGLARIEEFEPVQMPPMFLCAPSVSLELPRVRAVWDAIVETYTRLVQ